MKAKIEINLDNDAFRRSEGSELVRILRNVAQDLEEHPTAEFIGIMDINGNSVGRFEITEDAPYGYMSTMIDGDDNHYNE